MEHAEVEQLAKNIFELDAELKAEQSKINTRKKELDLMKSKLEQHLEHLDLKNYASSMGKITRVVRHAYSLPADPEDRKKAIQFIESQGEDIFNRCLELKNKAAGELFTQLHKEAEDRGDLLFEVPGCKVTEISYLQVRRS